MNLQQFALVQNGNALVKIEQYETAPTVGAGFKWLPYLLAIPSYNQATEKLDGPVISIDAVRVLVTMTAVPLTATEIDAGKTAEIDAIVRAVFLVLFDHENRLRALEKLAGMPNKNPITIAQAKTGMKALL